MSKKDPIYGAITNKIQTGGMTTMTPTGPMTVDPYMAYTGIFLTNELKKLYYRFFPPNEKIDLDVHSKLPKINKN